MKTVLAVMSDSTTATLKNSLTHLFYIISGGALRCDVIREILTAESRLHVQVTVRSLAKALGFVWSTRYNDAVSSLDKFLDKNEGGRPASL